MAKSKKIGPRKRSTKDNKVPGPSSKKGRKRKYDESYPAIAEKLCADQGYTDKNLAAHFHVSESTINKWKNDFSEFSESIKKGKWAFDTDKVVQVLLKRCMGYSYTEITKELDRSEYAVNEDFDAESVSEPTLVVTKVVRKHMAPDITGIIFWLKNRDAANWSDSREVAMRHGLLEEKPLTTEEIISRMEAVQKSDTGLDKRSIDGVGN